VAHVGAHDVEAVIGHHPVQLLDALLVGRDLGAQIGQVLVRIARRPAGRGQHRARLVLAQHAVAPSTSLKLSIRTPSSSMWPESGGIEPGVVPPMSAWWPREPT
jgi:pimeloyl-ACP methyl ester carboxylesterase